MPRVPDASSVTTFHRVGATITEDPVKKSRTFVAPVKSVIPAIEKASDVSRTSSPTTTILLPSIFKSPQFNGRFFLK